MVINISTKKSYTFLVNKVKNSCQNIKRKPLCPPPPLMTNTNRLVCNKLTHTVTTGVRTTSKNLENLSTVTLSIFFYFCFFKLFKKFKPCLKLICVTAAILFLFSNFMKLSLKKKLWTWDETQKMLFAPNLLFNGLQTSILIIVLHPIKVSITGIMCVY